MNLATRYKKELEALKEEDDSGYWWVLRQAAKDVDHLARRDHGRTSPLLTVLQSPFP